MEPDGAVKTNDPEDSVAQLSQEATNESTPEKALEDQKPKKQSRPVKDRKG